MKSIVSFIEWCGKHPFATGLFALVSLAGLAFSVYGFSLDRRGERTTSDDLSTIASKLDSLGDRLTDTSEQIPFDASLLYSNREYWNATFGPPISSFGASTYQSAGCKVDVDFNNDTARILTIEAEDSCEWDWSAVGRTGEWERLPKPNAATLRDVAERTGNAFLIASGCWSGCGVKQEGEVALIFLGAGSEHDVVVSGQGMLFEDEIEAFCDLSWQSIIGHELLDSEIISVEIGYDLTPRHSKVCGRVIFPPR